ncbi:hypothetical protein D3C81_1642750 [compost metagenome]
MGGDGVTALDAVGLVVLGEELGQVPCAEFPALRRVTTALVDYRCDAIYCRGCVVVRLAVSEQNDMVGLAGTVDGRRAARDRTTQVASCVVQRWYDRRVVFRIHVLHQSVYMAADGVGQATVADFQA